MSSTQSRVLSTMCVVLTIAVLLGGYVIYTQGSALSEAKAKVVSLEQDQAARQRTTDEALKGVQSQVAGLAANLTTTQNRLTADEQQLKLTAEALPPDLTALATKVTPSVVVIACATGIGSGFALKLPPDQGYSTVLATAAHVVKDCSPQAGPDVTPGPITISQAARSMPATLKSIDVEHDVALVQVTAQLPTLEPATTEPKPGQFVMAVGAPLGFRDNVTQGNVSKVSGEQFLHTANVSSGNSGGPLVDRLGKVSGIVSGVLKPEDNHVVVENLNVAVRLMALCDSALSGSACATLH